MSFPRFSACPCLILVLVLFHGLLMGSAQAEKPNLLVFITDDESWMERSAYGWSDIPTPNFDRVARDGVLFNYAYSSAPSCAPARASLLTGRNFWELEQGAFIQAWLPEKFPVFPEVLAETGYRTAKIGKGWGPGVYPEGAHGHESAGAEYQTKRLKPPAMSMSPINYAANFEVFLDERESDDQPFYCWAGIQEPHEPWAKDNYLKLKEEYGISVDDIPVPGFLPDTPAIRQRRANMFYEILYADKVLGQFLDILEERGELENTLVIATSDNGTSGPISKATVYDAGTHVPLAIMWPGKIPGNRVVDDFVNFPDLGPTLLEAAGCEIPESMSGRSLMDILLSDKSGQVDPERTTIVTGLEWHGELPPVNQSGRMIRDLRFEYIVRYGHVPATPLKPEAVRPDSEFEANAEFSDLMALLNRHPEHPAVKPFVARHTAASPKEELYDLENDPWQLHNLIDDPQHAEVRDRLKAQLHDYQMQTGDPRATGEMDIFQQTREFVIDRKESGYKH